MSDRQEAFPLRDRIDDALSYLGNVQEQLSSAKAEAYRLHRERAGAQQTLAATEASLERAETRAERAEAALWSLWHLDSLVEVHLRERFPDINDKIEEARRG